MSATLLRALNTHIFTTRQERLPPDARLYTRLSESGFDCEYKSTTFAKHLQIPTAQKFTFYRTFVDPKNQHTPLVPAMPYTQNIMPKDDDPNSDPKSAHNAEHASTPQTIPFMVVEDTQTMQVLASPVRWEILDAVSALGECSVAQIAEFTARARTSLYPHIQQLVESELIYETTTRLMGKRYEQLYKPKATMIGTRFNQDDPDNLDYHTTFANALARMLARKHQRASTHPGVNPRTKARNHHCGGHSVWVDDQQLEQLNAMIDNIWKFCEQSRPGKNKQLMHLGLFLSRHTPKSTDESK